jgi:glycosyltransferase involved in cell wall biosynthesis
MSKPKITFIIPVYNVEKYLRECLNSVVNQTLREIQIICVNDGSTDSSPAILNDYAAKDRRITVINLPNGGQSIARNTAYSYVRGEYIFFVDSDDFIDLNAAEKLYAHARLTEAEIVLFDMFRCKSNSKPYKIIQNYTQIERKIVIECDQRAKLILDSGGSACDKLYRSDLLLQNNIKYPEKLTGQDQAVMFLSLAVAKKIAIFPEPLYYYRMVASSTSHTRTRRRKQTDTIYVHAFIREELIRLGIHEDFKETFSLQKLRIFYRYFRRATYMAEKERMNIFRSNIHNDDVEHFYKNQTHFKKNERRVLSCIIENKPLSLYDKIVDQFNRLTPFFDYWKYFFRRNNLRTGNVNR